MSDKMILLLTMAQNSATSHAATKAQNAIPENVVTARGIDEDGAPVTVFADRAIQIKDAFNITDYVNMYVNEGDKYEVLTNAFHVVSPTDTDRLTDCGMQFAKRNVDELGIDGMDEPTAAKQITACAEFPAKRLPVKKCHL